MAAGKSGDAAAAGLPLVGEEAPQQVEVLVVDDLGVDARVLARTGAIGAAPSAPRLLSEEVSLALAIRTRDATDRAEGAAWRARRAG